MQIKWHKEFPGNFWVVNIMEMFERLAYFSVRAVVPLFMVAGASQHGLGLSYTEKGLIFAIWAAFQCFVPLFSGAFTDNFGYKKSLSVAFFLNICGYSLMANATGFYSMLFSATMVGIGTAIFKPPVQGTIASSVTEKNSSLGFGIFYWVVNIGNFFAPFLASLLRGDEKTGYTWHLAFYGAAFVTALNFIPALFFYKEPEKKEKRSVKNILKDIGEAFKQFDFIIFLFIFSGFWLMFMQVWDLLPNFINQWIDSRELVSFVPSWLSFIVDNGNIKPEQIININALCIILFMLPWSFVTAKMNRLLSITIGILIATISFVGAGMTQNGTMLALFILIFSFGEMSCSPKFSEYIGVNAPKDKKALYMGLSNIPFAIGWIAGNSISGPLYDKFANKTILAKDFLLTRLHHSPEMLRSIVEKYKLENPDKLGTSDLSKISAENFDFTTYISKMMNMDVWQTNKILWDTYHPWKIWGILASFGILTIISMACYSFFKNRSENKEA